MEIASLKRKEGKDMTPKELEELLKNAKPVREPKIEQKITKSCSNCMDQIVCWAEGKFTNDPDERADPKAAEEINEKRAKDCTDWHLDFMVFQELLESQQKEQS